MKCRGKTTTCVPIACFCKQKNNKGRKNNNTNVNNNRHNVLINDAEIELDNEADAVQTTTKKNVIK